MKVIELQFEDGDKWQIPLEFVAKHRADYYKSKKEDDFDYQGEVDWVMDDDFEGEDWLKNNMDYDDFKDVLKIIKSENEERDWCNAESEIIEVALTDKTDKEVKNNGN